MALDIQDMARSAQELIDVKYFNVVSFTLLLHDYLCTLDLEINLIWKAKWTTVKTLFLLARYTAFIDLPLVFAYTFAPRPSLKFCADVNAATLWLTAFGIACTEAILVVRTHALSGCNRKLLIYLVIQFIVLCSGVIVVLGITVRSLTYEEPPLRILPGCYLSWANPILFFVFILLVLHEIIIMIITLVIGYRKYRNHRTTLVQTLFGDGIIFFILLFFVSVANIINLAAGKPEHLDLFTTFQRVMHAILSTRILLHVRQVSGEAVDPPLEDIALSNVQFASNSSSEATTMPHGE